MQLFYLYLVQSQLSLYIHIFNSLHILKQCTLEHLMLQFGQLFLLEMVSDPLLYPHPLLLLQYLQLRLQLFTYASILALPLLHQLDSFQPLHLVLGAQRGVCE